MAEVYITIPSSIYRKGKEIDFMQMLDHEVDVSDYPQAQRRYVPTTVTRKYNECPITHDMMQKDAKIMTGVMRMYKLTRDWFVQYQFKGMTNEQVKEKYYEEHRIPKKTGGVRVIHEPVGDLLRTQQKILKILKLLTKNKGYHASAYAYIENRSILNCLNKHKKNESNWFLKLDLHKFFDSTDFETIMKMLDRIYPFNMFGEYDKMKLRQMLAVCMLDGGLPQGTVVSPMLTNLIMIPFDYELSKKLREKGFVYTRYADDMLISHKKAFKFSEVIKTVEETFRELGYPYQLNKEKTRYGSRAGRNWNLGLMLNKDNEITIGWRKKKQMKGLLTAVAARANGFADEVMKEDAEVLGLIAYYEMIDKDYTKYVIDHLSNKFNVDIIQYLKTGEVKRVVV